MKTFFLKIADRLRSNFWFLPGLMAAGAVVLASASVALERRVPARWLRDLTWVYQGGADGASAVLETIAGSMITLAGVVFSMTLVALTLASSQFGPRLLRNFMRDRSNQVVLGTFVSSFLYCLLVLRTIRRADEIAFVPHLSVTLGVVFALASLGVLIYFIDHVSVSIQADRIVAGVYAELVEGIERLFTQEIGVGRPGEARAALEGVLPPEFEREARAILSEVDGYVQFLDAGALLTLATEEDLLIRLEFRPGDYVVSGTSVAMVWPGDRADERLSARVIDAFSIGDQRTAAQDIEFTVNQLVEIAVRALSPGINDPFTAITCVDRLGSALCRIARREMPSPYRRDSENILRLVTPALTFPSIVDAAMNQIRQYGRSSTAVTVRLLDAITSVAACVHEADDREALRRQASMIRRGARAGLQEEEDRLAVEERFERATRALEMGLVQKS
ncbi:MAG: DUF2254 domain-containing protein [Acidobacteriota bacterium]